MFELDFYGLCCETCDEYRDGIHFADLHKYLNTICPKCGHLFLSTVRLQEISLLKNTVDRGFRKDWNYSKIKTNFEKERLRLRKKNFN